MIIYYKPSVRAVFLYPKGADKMKIDVTVVFANSKEIKVTDADNYIVDADRKLLEIIKENRTIFINFEKILYVAPTQYLN